jgi:hypothetical protein
MAGTQFDSTDGFSVNGTPVINASGAIVGTVSSSNVVNSFNGQTGVVSYVVPLATTSVTGVASFNSSDFTVSTGAVSLTSVARTNTANTFSQPQTFTTGISGNLSLNNIYKITDLLTPTNTYDAANKYYVDSIAAGLNYHPNCHVATTVALGATYDNGLTGVGAYLEALANGFIGQIDGHTADVNDRILVKDQTSNIENGIYYVSLTGSASQKWKLIRATDADNSIPGQVAGGDTVYVEMGTTNGGAGFVLIGTSGVGLTLGTSPIIWTQYTGVDVTTAGSGLSKSGNTLNVNVDGSTIQIIGDTLQLVNSSVTVNAGTGLGGGGTVSLGSGITLSNTGVLSFNGSTGAVTYAPPIASASATGVASFGDEFVVSAAGAVSLTSNYVKTVNGLTNSITLTANSASNMTITVQGSNIFVALGISSGTAEPSGGTDGNIYLQYTI